MPISIESYKKIYTFFSLTAHLQLKYFKKGWVYIVFPQKMIRAEAYLVKHLR